MTFGLWTANFVISTLALVVAGASELGLRAGLRLGVDLFGVLLCAGLLKLIDATPVRPFRRRVLLTLLLALAAALVNFAVNDLSLRWAGLAGPITRANLAINLYYVGYWFWFFLGWAGLYLAILYSAEVRAQTHARAATQISARDAQLRALRYQINPHFLFNTLNSLSALVLDRRTADSEAMIARLSTFLRTTLDDGASQDVELRTELEHQRLYLEIERIRFPELRFETDIAPEAERALVPGLILQPLVENAVKHGPAGTGRHARILVEARSDGPWLRITVTNDSVSNPPVHGMGLGLSNVRERLRLRFGDAFSIRCGPDEEARFEVQMALPLRMRE